MSQRWFAFLVASSFASAASAQSGPKPASDPAAEVPAPPPAAPTTPAPAPGPAPTAVPAATPSPAPADAAPPPAATPAPANQGPPPPPTFPQGSPPPSTTSSVEVTGQGPEELPPPPPPPEPLGMFGLTLTFGFTFGGDEIVPATTSEGDDVGIEAGNGASIGIGVVLMPLRTDTGHSLGVAVDQSAKFAQISGRNGSISLTRFPLVASLRYDYAFTDTWHLALGGGVVYEYGISITGDGDYEDLDVDLENAVGWMGEAGVAYRERGFVIDVTLRFTGLRYQSDVAVFDDKNATNGGLIVAGHYFF